MQAETEPGSGARAGEDPALVDVQGVRTDGDGRVEAGEQVGEPPVGGGPKAVEESDGGERERTDAVCPDQRAARVRGTERVQHGLGRRGAEVGPGQSEYEIGRCEPPENELDGERHPDTGGGLPGPFGAEREVETRGPVGVGVEDLGDETGGERADAGWGVCGYGDERHGGVRHEWQESSGQRHCGHSRACSAGSFHVLRR